MKKENLVFIAQLLGFGVVGAIFFGTDAEFVLGMLELFGVDITPEVKAKLLGGISALGLLITAILDRIQKTKLIGERQK